MNTLAKTWRIARFDFSTSLRTKRALLATLIYALGTFAIGGFLIWLQVKTGDMVQMAKLTIAGQGGISDGQAAQLASKAIGKAIDHGVDPAFLEHLMQIPLVVLGFFFVAQTFLPPLIAFMSYDIVNSEVRNRSARFVVLRSPRVALLAGKMVSHGLLFLAVTVLSNVILFGYAWHKLPDFPVTIALLWLLRFWLFTIIIGFCYLSLVTLVSSLVDSGALSLVVMILVLIGLGIVSSIGSIAFLSPSFYKWGLWSQNLGDVATSIVAYLVFGWIFIGLSWLRMAGRDL